MKKKKSFINPTVGKLATTSGRIQSLTLCFSYSCFFPACKCATYCDGMIKTTLMVRWTNFFYFYRTQTHIHLVICYPFIYLFILVAVFEWQSSSSSHSSWQQPPSFVFDCNCRWSPHAACRLRSDPATQWTVCVRGEKGGGNRGRKRKGKERQGFW